MSYCFESTETLSLLKKKEKKNEFLRSDLGKTITVDVTKGFIRRETELLRNRFCGHAKSV